MSQAEATGKSLALRSVENVEPEADERRFHKEIISLPINNRRMRFRVVARPQLRVVEHGSIEISLSEAAHVAGGGHRLVAACRSSAAQ